ncbi:hypothetical protein KR018_000756 [Drosophila ironensis]|nr:hypothetical protein KR018_000756 [Drosophila ironensis]
MSRVQRCLKSLASAGFLSLENNQLELLAHGQAYAGLLRRQWQSLRPLAAHLNSTSESGAASKQRFSFARSQQFADNFKALLDKHPRKAKCPTLLKHQSNSSGLAGNSLFSIKSAGTTLTTDFLVEPQRAREHFYNVQRESKIWWMRLSSNPSRYRIVPCDLPEEIDPQECQAIDITSGFGEAGAVTVEQLSLVTIKSDPALRLPDARTGDAVVPTVIRSVIELETATCALLLDGCDHGRESQSLLLNRILAPYQCGIACLSKDADLSDDLNDLCLHLTHVLQNAGLRLCRGNGFASTKEASILKDHLGESDMLGVPYTLLLNDETLKNGLLQLRSRDTMLAETIHISDVPDYLLNLFIS